VFAQTPPVNRCLPNFACGFVSRTCFEFQKDRKKNVGAVGIKSEVLRAAGVQRTLMNTIRQRQLNLLGQAMRRHDLENLVVTGKVEGRRARGGQRLKCLDSLSTRWKDNVSPTSEFQRTESSSITWSPTSSTMARHHKKASV